MMISSEGWKWEVTIIGKLGKSTCLDVSEAIACRTVVLIETYNGNELS